VFPCAGIEVGIGRGPGAARDAEQRAEGVERVETPVEAERELVEVGLEMLRAVDAVEPGLQVGEDEVDHRHDNPSRLLRIACLPSRSEAPGPRSISIQFFARITHVPAVRSLVLRGHWLA